MMDGAWIWIRDDQGRENERVCFVSHFDVRNLLQDITLQVTAVTKYQVWLNGTYLGTGPIRTAPGHAYIDRYSVSDRVRPGDNLLAIEVWNYGLSSYQSVAEPGGLLFSVMQENICLCCSDEKTLCCPDTGFISYAPKRNVNLGFSDYYDATAFHPDNWKYGMGDYTNAVIVSEKRDLSDRPIRLFHEEEKYPKEILRIEDAKQAGTVFSVNLRPTLFPGRTDANETIMTGFLGCEFEAARDINGRIVFPNCTWNGILGDFRIGDQVYRISDSDREVNVRIPQGRNLFLLRFHGKFDDLFFHMELTLEDQQGSPDLSGTGQDLRIHGFGTDRAFFTIGPTSVRVSALNGLDPITENMDAETEGEENIFACSSLQSLQDMGCRISWVPARYVMQDMYLLSLARLMQPVRNYAPTERYRGLLWNNVQDAVVELSSTADIRRILVDFGDIYVGQAEFTIWAQAGTVIDLYGFENAYHGEIDYTTGLNNGIRYICRDGWQHFRGMARIGLRYAVISIYVSRVSGHDREFGYPRQVKIRDLHLNASGYATAGEGSFRCSDDRLNRIWEMCRHTHEVCMEDSFTDCPTYEQAFWLGDAQTSAAIDHYVFGEYDFVKHNLLLGTTARANTPLFNALAPTDWNTAIPMWTFNWLLSVTEYIEVTGDSSVLSQLYDTIRRALLYYCGLLTEEGGLIVHAWNLIDWAHLDTPEGAVITAYQALFACCLERYAVLAETLGREDDAILFGKASIRMNRFTDERLWWKERRAFCDAWHPENGYASTCSIQTHSLLLLYDMVKDPEKKSLTRHYLERKPDDFVDVGSPFMLYYNYEARAKQGKLHGVLEDIRKRWGEMLYYDSTTCWEVFPGFYENARTRSYCHAWSAAPAALLQKYLLGVRMEEKGWAKASVFVPTLEGEDITWCRGSIPTPYGRISVDWDIKTKKFLLQVPEAISLDVKIPEDYSLIIKRTK